MPPVDEPSGPQGAPPAVGKRPYFHLVPVPIGAVTMGDGFWRPRLVTNYSVSIPRWLQAMEEHGVVDNFRHAAGRRDIPFRHSSYCSESDLYKWMEATALVLQSENLPQLRSTLGAIIDDVVAAQDEDGYLYLNTVFRDDSPPARFSRLESSHELYCAGHLMQAATAYYRATADEKLLTAACRYADLIVREFGPGKIETTDGHPEVELALIDLYRVTGRRSYLDIAGFFLCRPQSLGNLPPIAQRPALVGHCVRSGYICSAAADWYAETGDQQTWNNLRRLWQDLVSAKIYITGGVGSRHQGEAFGDPYELPNRSAYAETCAQIAHLMWAWRMLLASGEAGYADIMERILYNAFLSGVSLDGTDYFYENPLASDGSHRRWRWAPTNCCPPNLQRTLAALPGLMFSTSEQGLWVHLYDAARVKWHLLDGTPLALTLDTAYPWEGNVTLTVHLERPGQFTIFLRIPSWCRAASVSVNGAAIDEQPVPGTYLAIERQWDDGDVISLDLPMAPVFMQCHPKVAENRGSVALQRGPLVYCLEGVDNAGVSLLDVRVDTTAPLVAEHRSDLLGGVTIIRAHGDVPERAAEPQPLYRPLDDGRKGRGKPLQLLAIPYYAWCNRGPTEMTVWIQRESATA